MGKQTGTLKDFFDSKYKDIEVVGVLDSRPVYSMDNYVELNVLDAQASVNGISLANAVRVPETDDNGYLLRTPRERLVINEEIGFINRVRVDKENKHIHLVTDYRAITEQSSGSIYTNSVTAHVIGKASGSKSDKYAVISQINVPEAEFINEFTDSLKVSDAKLMYEVITHYRTTGTSSGISLDDLL